MRKLKDVDNAKLPRGESEAFQLFAFVFRNDNVATIEACERFLKDMRASNRLHRHNTHSVRAHLKYFAHFIDQANIAQNIVSLNDRALSLISNVSEQTTPRVEKRSALDMSAMSAHSAIDYSAAQ